MFNRPHLLNALGKYIDRDGADELLIDELLDIQAGQFAPVAGFDMTAGMYFIEYSR